MWRKRRYALEGTYWRKQELTYRIENYTPDLPRKDVNETFEKAINMWANASGLTFKREDDLSIEPDIRVMFVTGSHNDTRPTDGPGRELAHAFFPGPDNAGLDGDVHLDDDETFAINGGNGVDLLWLFVHELGHSLGLDPTYRRESVMFAYYPGLPGVERVTPPPNPTPKTCSDVKLDAM